MLILAPMDDVTDVAFRELVDECAPADYNMTEFVSVDGLNSPGRDSLVRKLKIGEHEVGRLIVQIWGKQVENFETISAQVVDMGFCGIDINMGCPDKTVVKNGCCSALIDDRDKAGKIIRAVQQGSRGKLPISVKTRIGGSIIDLSWIEFLLGFNLDMLTIHFRTRKEMSKVPAHWELAPEILSMRDKINPKTKIIGNGDVANRTEAMQLIGQYGVDGVMIGRGIFHDPYAFAPTSNYKDFPKKQKIDLYRKHLQKIQKHYGDNPKIAPIKKFAKIYINGFDHATDLRAQLMLATSVDDMLKILSDND